MFDRFNRRINYLRVSVTDRCNLRCVYCMPKEGIALLRHEDILSFEEIFQATATAVKMGIDKVRLTGGEPLVRRDIVMLVAMLAEIDGIKDFAMTTNGVLLDRYAESLAQAGLRRINISLDTLDPQRHKELTRGGDIREVLAGIDAATAAGLAPVKLNCVVRNGSGEPDARDIARFADKKGLQARFIRQMNISAGKFWQVEGGTGGRCPQCNRLRISSDGMVRPCLFSDLAFSIRKLGPATAITRALQTKPRSGQANNNRSLCAIGG